VSFVKEYGIGRLGAFAYSHEEDTPAFALEDDVPSDVIDARLNAVLRARDANLEATQREQIGKTLEVLIDEGTDAQGWALGRTSMDAPEVDPRVFVQGHLGVGERVQVRITDATDDHDLVGEVS